MMTGHLSSQYLNASCCSSVELVNGHCTNDNLIKQIGKKNKITVSYIKEKSCHNMHLGFKMTWLISHSSQVALEKKKV